MAVRIRAIRIAAEMEQKTVQPGGDCADGEVRRFRVAAVTFDRALVSSARVETAAYGLDVPVIARAAAQPLMAGTQQEVAHPGGRGTWRRPMGIFSDEVPRSRAVVPSPSVETVSGDVEVPVIANEVSHHAALGVGGLRMGLQAKGVIPD